MPATKMNYQLIRLNQTNRYAGYQFHSRIRMDGLSAGETFNYVVLTIYQWILNKIPEEDRKAPELQVPAPEDYTRVKADTFRPHHLNIGFALDITPLPEEGIWSLRIKETDSGTGDREPVVGRFFTTRAGVRLNDKGFTELGIRIDVTDPADEEREIPFAFRPAFVRTLGRHPAAHFEQITELKYGVPYQVKTEEDYRKLLYLLDSEDNQTPLVVFTFARPGEKKAAAKMSMEEFVKSGLVKSMMFSGSPGRGGGFPGRLPAAACAAEPEKKEEPPELLYDAAVYSKTTFAYAATFVLDDCFTDRFRTRIRKEFTPGDILLCGAKKFRGGVSVFGTPGTDRKELDRAFAEAVLAAQSYSKHKAPYDYGTVVFEAEARDLERQKRIAQLIGAGEIKGKEQIQELQGKIAEQFGKAEKQEKRIRELEAQKAEEFERGMMAGSEEIERLKEEVSGLRSEVASRQALIDHMRSSYEQAALQEEALEKRRSISAIPITNEDVVNYFLAVYGDRIGFTERGISTASKCGMKPEKVWDILYRIANQMADLFRSGKDNISEKDVADAAGFDMSFREGAETREREEFMRYRKDTYRGKEISVEPHLKFRAGRSEADYQRVHFMYDPETRRIVIGYMGDHLPSYSSRFAK